MKSTEFVNQHTKYIQSKLGHTWEAFSGDRNGLVQVVPGSIARCIDGRPPKGLFKPQKLTRSPALQGATEGLALILAMQGGRSEVDRGVFSRACEMTLNVGILPGVHDYHENSVHCAHANLAGQGLLGSEVPALSLSPGEMTRMVEEYGGENVFLAGEHQEKKVQINFVPNTTIEANFSSFVLDLWYATSVGLDRDLVLGNVMATLNGLRSTINKVEVFS
jgi:hypothetical protein